MLGEELATGAPVQQMKFDEEAFDRPPRRGRRVLSMLAVAAVLMIAVAVLL